MFIYLSFIKHVKKRKGEDLAMGQPHRTIDAELSAESKPTIDSELPANSNPIIEDGSETINLLYDYGVGIDTHRDFIQVCVYVRQGDLIKKYESERRTSWPGLLEACEWTKNTIIAKSIPSVNPEPLHYTIESTSTYHLPVCKAFQGKPSIVNPVLAGTTRRKTDVLDARLLAYHSITGLWPESFIVSPEIQEFRLLMRQRDYHARQCTAVSNRINNYVLRFGHTMGSYKSIRHIENRALLEDMCRDDFEFDESYENISAARFVCPEGLPPEVKKIIINMYADFDRHYEKASYYKKLALDYAKRIEWETDGGYARGDTLIKNLLTVPSVGEMTVLIWLSEVVTPLRFKTDKHISAFCGCDPSLKVSAGKVTSQTRRKGNAKLHHQLVTVAGSCISRHSEPFGKWGYALMKKHVKGGYKKACGAVARRLVTALYYVNKHNEPFSYDKYNFYKITVPDIDLMDMGFSTRVFNVLSANSLTCSIAIADMFVAGELFKLRGFGNKAAREVQAWIDINRKGGKGVRNG